MREFKRIRLMVQAEASRISANCERPKIVGQSLCVYGYHLCNIDEIKAPPINCIQSYLPNPWNGFVGQEYDGLVPKEAKEHDCKPSLRQISMGLTDTSVSNLYHTWLLCPFCSIEMTAIIKSFRDLPAAVCNRHREQIRG